MGKSGTQTVSEPFEGRQGDFAPPSGPWLRVEGQGSETLKQASGAEMEPTVGWTWLALPLFVAKVAGGKERVPAR